jgi:hypothetical protein
MHRGLGQFYSSTTVTVVAPWPSVFLERYGVDLYGSQPNQSRMLLLLIGGIDLMWISSVECVKHHNGMEPA